MAQTILFDASTGEITLNGTVDGVDLAGLSADVLDHDHVLGGNVSTLKMTMAMYGSGGQTTFYVALSTGGDSAGYLTAYSEDTHTHAVGTLATSNTGVSTALSPKTDDQILIDSATGDLVCDKIDGVAPEVLYDQFDDHTHTISGSAASTTLPAVFCYGVSGGLLYPCFRIADNSSGANPVWDYVKTNSGSHAHANSTISLTAYDAGSGAGSNDAGDPKFAARSATGNIETKGDVNDIGIAQFKAEYDAHTAHGKTGVTADYGQSDAALCGYTYTTKTYFLVTGGVWRTAFVRRLAHNHNGTTLTVAVPT